MTEKYKKAEDLKPGDVVYNRHIEGFQSIHKVELTRGFTRILFLKPNNDPNQTWVECVSYGYDFEAEVQVLD